MKMILRRLFEDLFVKPLILSLLDQFLVTALGFCLNLYLLRIWSPDQFGTYAIVIALGLIGLGVQSALVGSQLTVLRPLAKATGEEAGLLSSLWTANCLLVAIAGMLTFAGVWYFGEGEYPMLSVSAALYVGCMLLREYLRTFLFSEFRVGA